MLNNINEELLNAKNRNIIYDEDILKVFECKVKVASDSIEN